MGILQTGELAALGTALLWTISALVWTSVGKHVGALATSFLRLLITCVFLLAYGYLFRGLWLPTDASARVWLMLGASGFAGFFLADVCLFKAFVLIGPRLTLLLQSLSPPIAAVTSWVFLGENLLPKDWLAMGVTLGGVTWVVLEDPRERNHTRKGTVPFSLRENRDSPRTANSGESVPLLRRSSADRTASQDHCFCEAAAHHGERRGLRRGVSLAVVAAGAQAVGMVLARDGIGDYDAVAATFIRVLGAMIGYTTLISVLGRWPIMVGAARRGRLLAAITAGAFVGPFLGVVLCMISLRHCHAGITTTIISTTPVLVLPFVILLYREKVSPRAAGGAVLSVLGVALLLA